MSRQECQIGPEEGQIKSQKMISLVQNGLPTTLFHPHTITYDTIHFSYLLKMQRQHKSSKLDSSTAKLNFCTGNAVDFWKVQGSL